mgnify:CR=1 FL=1
MLFILDLNLFVFSLLNRPEGVAKGVEILSAEVACQCDEQKHREIESVIINNSCSIENKSPFVFPSEMQLCAEMEEMQQP